MAQLSCDDPDECSHIRPVSSLTSPLASFHSTEESDGFVTVRSKKRNTKSGRFAVSGSTNGKENGSSLIATHRDPQGDAPSTVAEEFASNIHEIHATILRARARVTSECGSAFLAQLVEAFANKFRAHLGREGPEEIVCYALGRFSVPSDWGFSCRLQLLLLQDLASHFHVPTLIYDPAFSQLEREYLESEYCAFSVIPTNEEAKRVARQLTLFYMIHAEGFLYDNLIDCNQQNGTLHDLVLFGNTLLQEDSKDRSWEHVEERLPTRDRSGLFSVALTSDTVLHLYKAKIK